MGNIFCSSTRSRLLVLTEKWTKVTSTTEWESYKGTRDGSKLFDHLSKPYHAARILLNHDTRSDLPNDEIFNNLATLTATRLAASITVAKEGPQQLTLLGTGEIEAVHKTTTTELPLATSSGVASLLVAVGLDSQTYFWIALILFGMLLVLSRVHGITRKACYQAGLAVTFVIGGSLAASAVTQSFALVGALISSTIFLLYVWYDYKKPNKKLTNDPQIQALLDKVSNSKNTTNALTNYLKRLNSSQTVASTPAATPAPAPAFTLAPIPASTSASTSASTPRKIKCQIPGCDNDALGLCSALSCGKPVCGGHNSSRPGADKPADKSNQPWRCGGHNFWGRQAEMKLEAAKLDGIIKFLDVSKKRMEAKRDRRAKRNGT